MVHSSRNGLSYPGSFWVSLSLGKEQSSWRRWTELFSAMWGPPSPLPWEMARVRCGHDEISSYSLRADFKECRRSWQFSTHPEGRSTDPCLGWCFRCGKLTKSPEEFAHSGLGIVNFGGNACEEVHMCLLIIWFSMIVRFVLSLLCRHNWCYYHYYC